MPESEALKMITANENAPEVEVEEEEPLDPPSPQERLRDHLRERVLERVREQVREQVRERLQEDGQGVQGEGAPGAQGAEERGDLVRVTMKHLADLPPLVEREIEQLAGRLVAHENAAANQRANQKSIRARARLEGFLTGYFISQNTEPSPSSVQSLITKITEAHRRAHNIKKPAIPRFEVIHEHGAERNPHMIGTHLGALHAAKSVAAQIVQREFGYTHLEVQLELSPNEQFPERYQLTFSALGAHAKTPHFFSVRAAEDEEV